MSRRMWEAVETKGRKSRVAKTKERRKKERSRKKLRGETEEKKEKTKERKKDGSKKDSRGMGDLGGGSQKQK